MPLQDNWYYINVNEFAPHGPGDVVVQNDPAPINWGHIDNLAAGIFGQQYVGMQQQNVQQEEIMKAKGKIGRFDPYGSIRGARSASPQSGEYQALAAQIKELQGSIHRESEELASALERISTTIEVVRDIGSTIQHRITTLQMAATQLETWRLTMPQLSSPGSEKEPVEGHSPPVEAPQPVEAGLAQVAPGLWQLGQV